MMRLVALVALTALACAEAPSNHNVRNERVIGGHDAQPNSWKWQISLQINQYNDGWFSHICGGSIIDAFHVITAAHCILSGDAGLYRVVAGEHNLYQDDGTEQFIGVERITVHPEWTGDLTNGNDIALLRLDTSVYDSGFVEIVRLPSAHQMLPHGYICYITGWGLIDFIGSIPEILQESPIAVVEHSLCSTYEWWGSMALKTMVCAGGDGNISGCQGDSGGPLSCFTDGAWRLHGVVSYGPAGYCNQYSKPTVFTRVASFLDWIYAVIKS